MKKAVRISDNILNYFNRFKNDNFVFCLSLTNSPILPVGDCLGLIFFFNYILCEPYSRNRVHDCIVQPGDFEYHTINDLCMPYEQMRAEFFITIGNQHGQSFVTSR